MSEFIQFKEIVLHAVILKMRSDNVAVGIVRRVLHRTEIRYILVLRDDYQATGMLPCSPLDAHKSQSEAVLFGFPDFDPALFHVLQHIAEGGLFCQSTDRSGTEHMV